MSKHHGDEPDRPPPFRSRPIRPPRLECGGIGCTTCCGLPHTDRRDAPGFTRSPRDATETLCRSCRDTWSLFLTTRPATAATRAESDRSIHRAAPRRSETIRSAFRRPRPNNHRPTPRSSRPRKPSTIPAKPFGDSTQTLAGVINSDGVSPGPGDTGVGTSPGGDTARLRRRGIPGRARRDAAGSDPARHSEIHRRSDASPDTRRRHDRMRRPARRHRRRRARDAIARSPLRPR